ncbi:MAG: hypothetical protein IJL82_03010, partial [Prevotella sp.]|nr:hypothetical protein [Prevotella sp.]
ATTMHLRESDFPCRFAVHRLLLFTFCYYLGAKLKQKVMITKRLTTFCTKKEHQTINLLLLLLVILSICNCNAELSDDFVTI